jgi:tetratricopeptide (TPR) repeat protein
LNTPSAHGVTRARILLAVSVFAVFFLFPYIVVALINELLPGWGGLPLACIPALSAAGLAAYFFFIRRALLRDYLAGLKHLQAGQPDAAAAAFESHYAFMEAHPRLDRWTWLALLDPAQSHRERALLALAQAALQREDGAGALAAYSRCLALNPENAAAAAALAFSRLLRGEDLPPPEAGL